MYKPVLLLLGMVVPIVLVLPVALVTVDVPLPELLYKPVLLLAGTTTLLVIDCPYLSENWLACLGWKILVILV